MAAVRREPLLLRLEPTLKDRLVSQAKRNDRTANSEASRILREGLERESSVHTLEPRA